MDLFEELRAQTRPAHDAIERLPAARAMIAGTISREDYTDVLTRLYWVHEIFEAEIGTHPTLADSWPTEAVRATAIANDLAALDGQLALNPPEPVSEWARLIRTRSSEDPEVWGGVGYVLEGSRMGSRMLVEPVARALGVPVAPNVGIDYHREGLDDPGGRWRRVRVALSSCDQSPAARAALVFGAIATFEVMTAVHSALNAEGVPTLVTPAGSP